MSIGDFVLAFVGIIIGLGVADLLTSFHKLLRAGKKVKWHWATPILAALMLMVTLVIWWRSYIWFSEIRSESIVAFTPKFLALVAVFLMMAAALPDEVPEGGIDLRQFYLSSRVHLWSLMACSLAASIAMHILSEWSIGPERLLATSLPTMVSLGLAITAAVTTRMWVHVLAIGWIFAVLVYNNLLISVGH